MVRGTAGGAAAPRKGTGRKQRPASHEFHRKTARARPVASAQTVQRNGARAATPGWMAARAPISPPEKPRRRRCRLRNGSVRATLAKKRKRETFRARGGRG